MNDDRHRSVFAGSAIAWDDGFLVGFPPLDRIHRDFVDALSAMQTADDTEIASKLQALTRIAKLQFDREDRWMQESSFPPRDCHVQEHASVMESFALVAEQVATGDIDEGRRLAAALADWFPKHMTHLDSALAHWMFKLRSAGKPIVLRRGMADRSREGA